MALAQSLVQWARCGRFPYQFLEAPEGLSEADDARGPKTEALAGQRDSLCALLEQASGSREGDEALIACLDTVLLACGRRGLLRLLGIRYTAGSVDLWPPPVG